MTIEAPITKVSPEQTFPQTPESGVALIGKYVVSEQRSRSFLYFVINRIIQIIFKYHFLHLIMAFQMLIITKNIKEGRRVPLLDA